MYDKKQIFVVDDDVSMSRAVERLLSLAGLQARTFKSAEALLKSNSAAEADCFILDIQLPGLSGFELCARLCDLRIMRPVFYITAYDNSDSRCKSEQTGAAGYFLKPFDGKTFIGAVKRAVGAGKQEPVEQSTAP